MTIQDTYGDNEPYADVDDELAHWAGVLAYRAAKVLSRADPRFEDVLQEGRIEFWRAYRQLVAELSPKPVTFALYRAAQRMRHVVYRDEPMTGHTRQLGRPEVKTIALLDQPIGDGSHVLGDVLLGAADLLAGVEMAYHAGEIADAIASLPAHHRDYVTDRFWHGLSDTEIAARQGLSSSKVLYNRWSRTIKPLLLERLAHLGVS